MVKVATMHTPRLIGWEIPEMGTKLSCRSVEASRGVELNVVNGNDIPE